MVANSGFAALNLANNHVYDAGPKAFNKMVDLLRYSAPDTQFYGLRDTPFASFQLWDKRLAVIGCLEPCRSRGPKIFREEDVLSLVRKIRGDFDKVFVTPHWGKEGEYAFHPSPRQRKLARRWIEAGVHGIFGHHSHTMHGYETISGHPVYYSLGNFFFHHEEGKGYPLTQYGLSVKWERKNGDHWSHSFIRHNEWNVVEVRADEAVKLNDLFWHISAELVDKKNPWTPLRWAKSVGPIYIAKSRRSWRLRLKMGPFYKVLPLWAVWCFLPTNLLLRWGSWRGIGQIENNAITSGIKTS